MTDFAPLTLGDPDLDAIAGKILDQQRARAASADRRAGPTAKATPFSWRMHTTTAAELRMHQFPPVSYVVPALIPEGLSLLAGRPKVGKSWAALDIAIAVAGGGACFGDREPTSGDVLYAAMEDNPRRLQRRIDKILSPFSDEWPERLTLTTAWRRLDQGGVNDIGEWVDAAAEPRLVILDTLAGVRPVKTQNGYAEDYEALAALHRLANDQGIAVLVLHHTRKMEADDPIDTVSGTLGLTGCADTVLVIGRSSKGTTLYVRGRDIEEAEHAVEFNRDTCRWSILGKAAEVHRSAERTRILEALGDGEATVNDLVAATGMARNALEKLLHFMVKDGDIERPRRGVYSLNGDPR